MLEKREEKNNNDKEKSRSKILFINMIYNKFNFLFTIKYCLIPILTTSAYRCKGKYTQKTG